MTKKDFKLFAELVVDLEKLEARGEKITSGRVEDMIQVILSRDNWRFDWDKWNNYKTKIKGGKI